MKGTNLGEFEELVLLTVGVLGSDAYGISIKDDIKRRSGRSPSIGALHSSLTRLESKGYLISKMEDATPERRGRRKRFYVLTKSGIKVLRSIYEMRRDMINLIPDLISQ